jgi:hypothetical protein
MFVLLAFTTFVVTLAACSTESRHRTIIYDQQWSSAAGVKNLWCVPELRASCERQVRKTEATFSKTLSTAFRTSPEVRNCSVPHFNRKR